MCATLILRSRFVLSGFGALCPTMTCRIYLSAHTQKQTLDSKANFDSATGVVNIICKLFAVFFRKAPLQKASVTLSVEIF